ncbi:SlyX family protein [Vibrio ruber]|nr:SlyX family protein [Vibrio ruber]WNJ96956.1 SlyX family protein [Vibrio ruber]
MAPEEAERLEARINDLECQLAFQEDTIEALNQALSQQQQTISRMQDQMKFMAGKLKNVSESPLADSSQETPPPHY